MRAIVTGGASGIGAAAAEVLRERGARVIVLDRDVEPSDDAIRVDVTDAAGVTAAVDDAVARLGGLDVLVNNAGIGAAGHRRGQPGRGVAPGLRRQRGRDGPRHPRRPPPPARVLAGRDRQHLLGGGDRRAAEPRALQRHQGRRALPDARDGRRPRRRGHPRELRQPGHGRHALGRPPARRRRRPDAERAALEARQPMGRLVSAREVAEAIAYLAGPATPPPPAPSSESTEACRTSAYVNRTLKGTVPFRFAVSRPETALSRVFNLKGTVPFRLGLGWRGR